jgi:hypothetical protein
VGATAADAPPFFVRSYTPLDVPDWLTDDKGALTAITVLEALPRTSFDETTVYTQARRIFADGWQVYQRVNTRSSMAQLRAQGTHDFAGVPPVVPLYGKRRALTPILGQSILGDPMLFVDDYNLTSEIRELLRKQTFSMVNVPLGTGDAATSLEQAQAMMGQTTGAMNVLFSPVEAQILSADNANVTVYQSERQEVRRAMFRLAGLPWEADSRDAESAESRKIKREDLAQTLATYAQECQIADVALAQMWFRGTYGAQWQQEWEQAQVTIQWPTAFDSETLDDLLKRVQLALGLELGQRAEVEAKKRVVRELFRTLPPETLAEIDTELEALPTKSEQREAQLQAGVKKAAAFGKGD